MVDQTNDKKKSCPTRGCYGQGNIENENFEGRHTRLASCPLAFIENQNSDLINNLRTEILSLKTGLNVDIPRYVAKVSSLEKLNSDLKLKIQQMSASIDQHYDVING